ncbi:MAG: hypothetical protein A3G24_11570 [Betaproteobacteria bacterium RIFCSPLOWO2_12_FULL_62_13]|nr:MAG: hypothetical protein A3G24_11570 [Betaproteobacteria bacterium RIFCSPLOWO2_12_FULL_62_13]
MPVKSVFSGIRVLDVTRILASPFASGQLAFLGADVVKIEDPGAGDAARYGHSNDRDLAKTGMSSNFLSQNSNKRSVTLNLRTPEGQRIFRKLAEDADIVIQNLRTGSMDRYGLGYEDLRKINPRIIYCSLTAYGATGPKKRHPAYDPVVQAASGMMSINGTPETAPLKVGPPVVDYGAGLAAAFAIASALYHRERTGEGQHIDVSMLDTAFVLMGSIVTDVMTAGAKPRAHGNSYVSIPTNAGFETREGLLYIAAMQEHHVKHLCESIGRADLLTDPRYLTHESRSENGAELRKQLEKAFKTRTAAEWEEILNEAGVPAMRVRTIPEAVREPYLESRKLFHVFKSVAGVKSSVTVPLVPFKLSACEARADTPPPTLGADTDEVLRSVGYSAREVAELRERHIV